MSKRWISILLVLCLVFSLLPASAAASEADDAAARPESDAPGKAAAVNPFTDVTDGAWYYDDVLYVYENGIFNGMSETVFAPGGTMSRAMFVTVLGRMAGVRTENYAGGTDFIDVAENAYYAPYVAWAVKYGITNGTGPNTFTPNAALTRQELATFFVRYFEAFEIDCGADSGDTQSVPGDLDTVAGWAKDAVLKLWRAGLINGSGGNFDPSSCATRAQAAAICRRAHNVVDEWRAETAENPETTETVKKEESDDSSYYAVTFYDGARRIATLYALKGEPLGKVPSVEQSSRDGAILLGYYKDLAFTKPFYADEPVTGDMIVYAKYQEMESTERLNFTSFAQMDMKPDLSFTIRRVSGAVVPEKAAALTVKDGSDPVTLSIAPMQAAAAPDPGAEAEEPDSGSEDGNETEESEPVYSVSAVGGFNEGCSYELTLADGWIFDGKPETIRTASFSIFKKAVDNLAMSSDIKYLADTDAISYTVSNKTHPVLTSALATEGGEITYSGDPDGISGLAAGDILCVYVGVHPEQRTSGIGEGSLDGRALLDPAVYVKVESVSGGSVAFKPLEDDDRSSLYDVPDNFPLLVSAIPTGTTGAVDISSLDIGMYEQMLGAADGNLAYAREKINVGDFVTLYTRETKTESDAFFGQITAYNAETGEITYTETTEEAILESMDLYAPIDLDGSYLVTGEQEQAIIAAVEEQLEESDFAEQAARMLAELVIATDEFQNDPVISGLLGPDEDGLYTAEAMKSLASSFTLSPVTVKARLITKGSDLHFKGGVQLAVDVSAKINAPIDNSLGNTLSIDIDGTFIEELCVKPTVKGSLVTKKVLFIPVPIGVEVGANIDIKNYTALRFDAEISTHDNSGILYSSSISSDLQDLLSAGSNKNGSSALFQSSLADLMERYSDLLMQETDWITLIEEPIFEGVEVGIKAVGIGIEGNFVVKTDMSLAIGSNLEYETGKRYSFWFRVGAFKPTAGSSTMDLIDESFAFQFYVMGKLGVRAGVKLTLYVQLGGGKLAKAGVSADLGPYIKLYGFFIYEVSKYRPKNTNKWNYSEQMAGALYLEFGLYVTLSFEASALTVFEYSHDFLDEEIPLLTAGDPRYYYGFNYSPEKDEYVIIRDDDSDSGNGISMKLPDSVRELSYMTLDTGYRGYSSLPRDRYNFTVSNPNFSYNSSTGVVSVTVPNERTHFMECDLTITYLYGKLAFSSYDMSVTVPLVWTDLNDEQLKEYFTASVRVGNDTDGYETVWRKRVLRGQEFELPTDEEICALIGCSGGDSLKFASVTGYEPGLTGVQSVKTDTAYNYLVDYCAYDLTVDGIENSDGSTRSETFTAKYGQAFDFSALKNTGTNSDEEGKYTKFTGVTAPGLDLARPIDDAMARALNDGVTARANYVDDSVTAVFTFSGITHDDITVKCRRGTMPDQTAVQEAVEEVDADDTVAIGSFTPALDSIRDSTNYVVNCVTLSGERADVEFDMNAFDMSGRVDMTDETPETRDRLVGSLIINLPEVEREGYGFDGWYTEPEGGERAETRTVPDGGITLYAHWTPLEYTLSFNINGGDESVRPESRTVVYDEYYGELTEPVPAPETRFVGWYTEQDGGTKITEDDIVKITEDTTLYAHYKALVPIDPNWLDFGDAETFTYSKGVEQYAEYGFSSSYDRYEDEEVGETVAYPAEGFALNYVGTSGNTDSTTAPVNAGTYRVTVTRPADGMFAAFEAIYEGVLVINKATRSVEGARPERVDTLSGSNHLTVGVGAVDDLGSGARVEVEMELGGTQGITTREGNCFFYGLSPETNYTATLTHISIKNDPNYNDVDAAVSATAAVTTKSIPTKYWRDHTSNSLTTSISTAEELAALMRAVKYKETTSGTYTLTADIDMSAYKWDTADGIFSGTFNGNGHAIYGIYSDCSGSDNVGLFGKLASNAQVRNVVLAGGYFCGSNQVGGIAGYANDYATIDNCVNYATVYASGNGGNADVGGIVGRVSESQNDGKGTRVRNCVNYGSVDGNGYHTGGIIGYQLGSSYVSNCANYGSIHGSSACIGGIVGENYNKTSVVYNCVNAGTVTGSGSYRGAIVGRNNDDSGKVEQGYYRAGSSPDRTGVGSEKGSRADDYKDLKLASFTSYTAIPSRVVEDGCSGSMTLLQVLNHWADRCGSDYSSWTLSGPGGAPIPDGYDRFPKL